MPNRRDFFNSPFGREVGTGLKIGIINLTEAVTEALFGKKPGRTRQSFEQDAWEAKRNFERAKRKKDSDPYQILGVTPDAPFEVIEAAYKVKAKKAHPDKGGSEKEMRKINWAYSEIKKRRS